MNASQATCPTCPKCRADVDSQGELCDRCYDREANSNEELAAMEEEF
jgi:tRNA(Ile2) C34 agmatinyltransferase TiaS